MVRRALAFALVSVMVGAPLAGDVCHALCVNQSHRHSAADVQVAHHHHQTSEPDHASTRVVARSAAHACDDDGTFVGVESRNTIRASVAATAMDVPGVGATVVDDAVRTITLADLHGPPGHLRSAAPLRI